MKVWADNTEMTKVGGNRRKRIHAGPGGLTSQRLRKGGRVPVSVLLCGLREIYLSLTLGPQVLYLNIDGEKWRAFIYLNVLSDNNGLRNTNKLKAAFQRNGLFSKMFHISLEFYQATQLPTSPTLVSTLTC